MRRKDLTVQNINPANTDYPFGRIRDNQGAGDGTPVIEALYGDIHETITAIVKDSQIVIPNGLPDNASNGYQIFQAMFQTPTKHNIVYDFETNEDNKFVVNEHISNLKPKEYMVLNFVGTDDVQNVINVNRIIDKSGVEFQCFVQSDNQGNFFSSTRYFIERNNSETFTIYPIVSKSLLNNIYERLETLEMIGSDAMRILHKGSYIHTDFSPSGIAVIPHDVVSVSGSRVIITCTRSNSSNSITTTDFSYIMIDRSANQFRVAFNNYPASTNLDPLRIDWWVVRN